METQCQQKALDHHHIDTGRGFIDQLCLPWLDNRTNETQHFRHDNLTWIRSREFQHAVQRRKRAGQRRTSFLGTIRQHAASHPLVRVPIVERIRDMHAPRGRVQPI